MKDKIIKALLETHSSIENEAKKIAAFKNELILDKNFEYAIHLSEIEKNILFNQDDILKKIIELEANN